MKYKYVPGDHLYSFLCTRSRFLKEAGGILYEFEHKSTGAKLLWLDTDDSNKLFSVSFRTVPSDSTGVFHILEHSVLCGSGKYPVREPFVELLKSSMNTFLNAMTFADKTMYPVSSRNEKDFLNLTSVYLDAVFDPAIYVNPCIFYQEGWHYEYKEGDEIPSIKGVVFNEMKGAESSLGSLMDEGLREMLFPDSTYRFNSGGSPEHIPELTYDGFLAMHKEFYSPGNAVFYLEGDMDEHKPVALICSYVDQREQSRSCPEVGYQKRFQVSERRMFYPVSPGETLEEKVRIAFGRIIADYSEKEKMMAVQIVNAYLCDSNGSPLRKAIMERGLAQDIAISLEDGILQPYLVVGLINTEEDRLDRIKEAIRDVMEAELKRGMDRKALEAALNSYEFSWREPREPKGLMHNIAVMETMLYGGDPAQRLVFDDSFRFLREKLGTGYYEDILKQMLSTDEMSTLIMIPSETLSDEMEIKEKSRIEAEFRNWDASNREKYLALNNELELWQNTPDTREQLDTIPKLQVSDVDELPVKTETFEKKIGNIRLLTHPGTAPGIVYLNIYFPVPVGCADDLFSLSLFGSMFGKFPTAERDLMKLMTDLNANFGDLGFSVFPDCGLDEGEEPRIWFTVGMSLLEEKLTSAFEIMEDILFNTSIGDKELLRSVLTQMFEGFRNSLINNGSSYGTRCAAAGLSAIADVSERMGGVTTYPLFKDLLDHFDKRYEDFCARFEKLRKCIISSDDMIIGLTADGAEDIDSAVERYGIRELISRFPVNGKNGYRIRSQHTPSDTYVKIPSSVSYACAAGSVLKGSHCGQWLVGSSIISLEYLWNEIRVKGGAYGTGENTGYTGNVKFYSYRDPDPVRSFSVYKNSGEFLRTYLRSGGDIDSYIISTVGGSEPLMSPAAAARAADSKYIKNMAYDYECRMRREVLHTTNDDLMAFADTLDSIWEKSGKCLFSSDDHGFEADTVITV